MSGYAMKRHLVRVRILHVVIIVLLSGLCVTLVEGGFYIFNAFHKKNITIAGDILKRNFFQDDDALGYKPKPNMRVTSIFKENDTVIYNAVYSTDNYSRRLTPDHADGIPKKKFALFFGCSYTFGEGLNDNETLPYFFSRLQPAYRSYNYGLSGYGPQQMLEHLKRKGVETEIAEKKGILIYTFIDHHVNRVIGTMRSYSIWADIMPYYFLDEEQKLVRQGSFRTGRPFLNAVYGVLNKSQVVKALNLDFPKIRGHHLLLTARIFDESKKIFEKKFKSNKFYVLFYPGSQHVRSLKPYLQQFKIDYLDYSGLFDPREPQYHITGDVHPSAAAFKILAEQICHDMPALAATGPAAP